MVGDGAEGVGEADAQVGLLQHVEQAGHRPAPADFGLECDQPRGFLLFLQRRERDPSAAALEDANIRVAGQAAVERGERLGHLCPHARDKSACVPRQPEGGVMFVPPDLEIRGQILVGVAVAIRAFDPDLLAAQLLAQRLQRADLIGDPVDLGPALGVTLDHGGAPGGRHDAVERHRFLGRVAVQLAVGVAADHGERIEHRPVFPVVGPECQGVENDGQHAAIVRAVGAADHRVQVTLVQRARGLALGDQVAQGLLIDDRKDDLAHRIVRPGQACHGELEQQRRLAGDTSLQDNYR